MKKENKKLGMGLGALLSPTKTNKSNVNKIYISKFSPNKQQPRKNFEDKDLQELSHSIKNQGLRRHLVNLLKSKGINSKSVLKAIGNVPRQHFMDPSLKNFSYEDQAYPISSNQTISQPFTVAFQTQLLEIESGNKILEIGTGSGYQTAILLEFSPQIYTI